MGIRINKLITKNQECYLADITHGKERFEAQVCGGGIELNNLIGSENLLVELDYEQLLRIKILKNFKDTDSIISRNNKHFKITGIVNGIVKIKNDQIIDLHIQAGESISILKSEIGALELKMGMGITIEVTGLQFFLINI